MERQRLVVTVGIGAGALATVVSAAHFVLAFPGVRDRHIATTHEQQTLPMQATAFRPTVPAALLAGVRARGLYVSVESPEPAVVLRREVDTVMPLASLTKLMTALTVLERAPDWNKEVDIIASDMRGGAKSPLSPGSRVRVSDLWTLMLMSSDNNATAALVRSIEPESDFVARMNASAQALGLSHTRFVEPTGLDPANTATPREFAVIARRALREPRIAQSLDALDTEVLVSGRPVRIFSTDQQLKTHQSLTANGWQFLAGKTGYVTESGYNVAFVAKGARDAEFLVLVFGSETLQQRATESSSLAAWIAKTFAVENLP